MSGIISTEISHNRKTGPVSATYAAQTTCPSTCPLRKNGCYAESKRTGLHTYRINKTTASALTLAKREADGIDKLSGLMDLRVHVVGDCKTDAAAKLVSSASERFMKRKRPTLAWSYTHAWKKVKRASWGKMSILASCHNIKEVKSAIKRGYATAMTVEHMPAKAYKKDGLTFVPCLEQTRGTTCVECRLCFKDEVLLKKNLIVLFAIHTAPKKAMAALKRYATSRAIAA